jgi:predicted component of type VI protein secretion system
MSPDERMIVDAFADSLFQRVATRREIELTLEKYEPRPEARLVAGERQGTTDCELVAQISLVEVWPEDVPVERC